MPTTDHDHPIHDLPPIGDCDTEPLARALGAFSDLCPPCCGSAVANIAEDPLLTLHTLMLGYLALVARHQEAGLGKPHLPTVASEHYTVTLTVWSALSQGAWGDALAVLTNGERRERAIAITDALDTFTSLVRQFPDASPFTVDADPLDGNHAPVTVIDPTGCSNSELCTVSGHYATCPKFRATIMLTVARQPEHPGPPPESTTAPEEDPTA